MTEQIGLPEAFVRRAAEQLGEALPAFLQCYERPPLRGLRLNPMKPADERLLPGLMEPVPWAADGRFLAGDSRVGATALHEAGACYIQEPSAMLPAAVLAPEPGEAVLDLCAAPGGKSTQIAAAMRGRGLLVCNEPVPKRAQVLAGNLERFGVTNALAVSALPESLAARWPGGFDAVLVDAPCSGEGMFRRDPQTRLEWTEETSRGCAQRQAGILDAASELVRPGGRIVYSTCTFNPAENEDNVAAFLKRHTDFRLQPFSVPGAQSASGMLTCWPHEMPGEGQFTALLKREGERPAVRRADASLPRPGKAEVTALRAFAAVAPAPTALLGGTLFFLESLPDVRGLRVLRAGVHLGALNGKIFRPDHAWALSWMPPDLPAADVDAAGAARYLSGETLPDTTGHSGYVLVRYAGQILGFGKASGGVIKNHYPKGLRRRTDVPDN